MAEVKDKQRTLDEELQTPETRAKIEKFLREHSIECLDDVILSKALAKLLCVNYNPRSIRKAVVEQDWISGELPKGKNPIRKGPKSSYFDVYVVGEEFAFKNLEVYASTKFKTLDDIPDTELLASLLEVENTPKSIRRAVVGRGWMSRDLPEKYNPIKRKSSSYFNSDVVGKEYAMKNLSKCVRSSYKTLDDIPQSSIISNLLGVAHNQRPIRKAVFDQGWISGELPEGYKAIREGKRSSYFDPYVVGKETVMKNLEKYITISFSTLDDVPRIALLASLLNTDDNPRSIRKAVVGKGWMSKELPEGYNPIKARKISSYLDVHIIGKDAVMQNLKKYINTFKILDNIPNNGLLASLLGASRNPRSIKKILVDRGWISGELPEGYNPIREGKRSSYFDVSVVGEETVMNNLRKYITNSFETLDDIPFNMMIASLLGADKNIVSVRKAIAKLGLFSLKIGEYSQNIQNMIIENILRPGPRTKSFYIDHSINSEVLRENLNIIFKELNKELGVKCLDNINAEINKNYKGFLSSIGVKSRNNRNKVLYYPLAEIKTRFIHFGYFYEDIEQKYGHIKHKGTAVELLKKIDRELFDYKDIQADESKVDMISFEVLKKLNKETQQTLPKNKRPRNSLDLFEYYQKEYAK